MLFTRSGKKISVPSWLVPFLDENTYFDNESMQLMNGQEHLIPYLQTITHNGMKLTSISNDQDGIEAFYDFRHAQPWRETLRRKSILGFNGDASRIILFHRLRIIWYSDTIIGKIVTKNILKYPKLEIITQYYEGFLESFVIDSSNVADVSLLIESELASSSCTPASL